MSDMDFDEYKKEVLDPILESEEDIEKRSKLKDSLSQAFEETRSFYEKLPPYESPYTNLNFSTKPNKSRECIREFMGLEFDVSKFHVNSYYNIKSELINFTNVKLCSVCYGELVFCVNDGDTVKNFIITPKIAGVNSIIFEEVD
jgi:hypothetical protein